MPATPHLLIWTENYWIGGCDRFVADLISGFDSSSVKVTLAGNPHPEFDLWLADRVPQVLPRSVIPVANLVRSPLHRLDRWRAVPPLSTGTVATSSAEPLVLRTGVAGARYAQATLNLARLRRLVQRIRPDVMLINNGGYPGGESCRVAGLAARQAGVARVVHFVHNMAYPPAWPPTLERALDRRVDEATDRWVTAAKRASDQLSDERGIRRDHISTVNYGIPNPPPTRRGDRQAMRAALDFAEDEVGVVAIANLEPRKGLDVLLRALADLRAHGVQLRAAVIGDGPERARLEADVSELGLADTVRMLGRREDVDMILSHADVFVLPSLANECLPYVILEAMSHGLPVVSTDVAGIPEMVRDGETGRVVAPGDVLALGAALAEVAGDRNLARAMGARGRVRLGEHFTAQRMMAEMRKLLALG